MSLDTSLSIGAFAVSVGGLVPVFVVKEQQRKQVAAAVMIVLLICLTGIAVIRSVEHARAVEKMQANIIHKLSDHEWTFEQLLAELHYPEPAVFSEALFQAVADGTVEDRLDQIQTKNEDLPVAIRFYHIQVSVGGKSKTESASTCLPVGTIVQSARPF